MLPNLLIALGLALLLGAYPKLRPAWEAAR